MEAVRMMLESAERAQVKRLTLNPHYDPRVEDFVVNEVLTVFNQAQEEELRLEEELRKQDEEQKLLKDKDTSDDLVVETSERVIEDQGKAVASEHDPLVLMLQEQLATQKAEQE
ncbi:hypothetical protein A2U01_0058663, partial [Trifolium medium]|nr:hypothetical protein [Trifolium medium]